MINEDNLPKVVAENKININGTEFRVCVLDNGQRIIPEEDMDKALGILGLSLDDFKKLLKVRSY